MSYIGLSHYDRNNIKKSDVHLKLGDEEYAGLVIDRGEEAPAFLRFNKNTLQFEEGIDGYSVKQLTKTLRVVNNSIVGVPSTIYLADTSLVPISIMLPHGPVPGTELDIIDMKGTFAKNPVSVIPNGSKIMGSTDDILLDVDHSNSKFIYLDNHNGWILAPSNPIALSAYNLPHTSGSGSPGLGGTIENLEDVIAYLNSNIGAIMPSVKHNILNDIDFLGNSVSDYLRNNFEPLVPVVAQTVSGSMPTVGPSVVNYLNQNITDIIPSILQFGINETLKVENERLSVNHRLPVRTMTCSFVPELYKYHLVDTTTVSVDITLPTDVQDGDWFDIYDAKNNFTMQPAIIKYANNNITIDGYAQDKHLDRNATHYRALFSNNNWILLNQSNSNQIDLYDNILISKSSNFTAEHRKHYLVNTTNAPVYVNLPCNPQNGFSFIISDEKGTFANNNVVILNNSGQTILGKTDSLSLDVSNTNIRLVYNNGDWISATAQEVSQHNNIIIIDTDFIANVTTSYRVNTTNDLVNVQLPSSPLNNSWVNIRDHCGTFDDNMVIVRAAPGNTIENGSTENPSVALDIKGTNVRFIYCDGNWNIVSFFE